MASALLAGLGLRPGATGELRQRLPAALMRGAVPGLAGMEGVGILTRMLTSGATPDLAASSESGRPVMRGPAGSEAEAVGSAIFIPQDSDDPQAAIRHEGRHADQMGVLGPGGIGTALRLAEPFQGYGRGPLERDAFRNENSSAGREILRQKPAAYSPAIEGLLRGLLGE